MRIRFTLLALFVATPLVAGMAGNELWFPVATRLTTVYVTNVSGRDAAVKMTLVPGDIPGAVRTVLNFTLRPHETLMQDLNQPAGALSIVSNRQVIATALLRNAPAATGTTLEGIPARFAIATGDTTIVHGSASARYRLYAAEIHGFPLHIAVQLRDRAGRLTLRRTFYLGSFQAHSWDFVEPVASLEVRGLNGSGRVVVAGAQVGGEGTTTIALYPMLLRPRIRQSLPSPEVTAYATAAIALAIAAVRRRG